MTGLPEETLRVGDERDRLDDRLDDLADRLVDADPGTATYHVLQQEASSVETMLGGVTWLLDEGPDGAGCNEDDTVTVAALDAGMFARVDDRAADMRAVHDGNGGLPGARTNVFAAAGLQDAPFLEQRDDWDALTPGERLDVKLDAVTSGMHVGVRQWIHDRVDTLTTASDGDFRRLSERLAERTRD